MKKLTLLIILCLALMITLSSCNDVMTVTTFAYDIYRLFHECTPGQWETVSELSCTTPGINVKQCIHCGFVLDMEVIAPEHTPVNLEYQGSDGFENCENRLYSADCSVCGKKISVIGALEHDYYKTVVESSCSQQGYEISVCIRCGDDKTQMYDYLGSHKYQETYSTNTLYHWNECRYCSEFINKQEHTEGDDGLCTVCKMTIPNTAGVIYKLSDDRSYATVTGYNGSSTHVKIASEYMGAPVTHIGEGAFASNSDLISVNIPDSVTHIGDCAFSECNKLRTILHGRGIKYIGREAFKGCRSMELSTLPEGLEYIADYAFYECQKIELSHIPDGVTYIGNYAFALASGIDNMIFGSGVTYIGESAFYDCRDLESVSFSEGLLFIGNRAFYNCSLASLAIPDSTISIGEEAFLSVDPLTEVYLGSGLSELGAMAFKECYRLEKITVSDDNSSFKSIDGVLYTKDGKTLLYFPQAKSGTGFFIPEEVVTIGDYAFYKATGIIELEIPASVEIIGESAFREAASLKKVQISGAREIRDYAFYDCENITVLTMKEGTVSIGNQAFAELGSLTVVLIPDSVTHLGDGAFMFLYNLRILKIGEGITEIPYAAFAYCTSISAVDLHEGVKIIGDRAFDSCYEMRSINLSNVTSIGKNAFYSCHKLGSVDLRNAVTIGEWAFHDCSNITSAVLGRELESIGAGAFNCFEYLKKIYYCGTADQWELLTIGDDNSPLHYPTRRYYYSESEPAEYGRFWHYDESGNVVVW